MTGLPMVGCFVLLALGAQMVVAPFSDGRPPADYEAEAEEGQDRSSHDPPPQSDEQAAGEGAHVCRRNTHTPSWEF